MPSIPQIPRRRIGHPADFAIGQMADPLPGLLPHLPVWLGGRQDLTSDLLCDKMLWGIMLYGILSMQETGP